MTTLDRRQPPPPDDWKCAPGGHPLCQVCDRPLANKVLRDPQLGPCCLECAPHVIAADKILYWIKLLR